LPKPIILRLELVINYKRLIMKRTIVIILTAVAFFLYPSCKKENRCDCFKSTGGMVTQSRNLSGFNRLLVEDDVNVYIKQAAVFDVQVTAGENLIELIKTEVKNGELIIQNNNKCNFIRSYEPKINVYVTMPEITYITHEGIGLIKSMNTFTTAEFDIWTKSSGDIVLDVNNNKLHTHLQRNGDITVSGKTNELTCFADHSGVLEAKNLIASKYVWMISKTTGDTHFYITSGLIDITMIGVGNVYYSGNPTEIKVREEGKGRLIKQ
jgi:hypothetical protein